MVYIMLIHSIKVFFIRNRESSILDKMEMPILEQQATLEEGLSLNPSTLLLDFFLQDF